MITVIDTSVEQRLKQQRDEEKAARRAEAEAVRQAEAEPEAARQAEGEPSEEAAPPPAQLDMAEELEEVEA